MLPIVIILLTLLMLVNIALTFSIIGGLGTSHTGLLQEVQHQARITRHALVELSQEPSDEEKAAATIVNSPAFSQAVMEDAHARYKASGIRWFGESEQEAEEQS